MEEGGDYWRLGIERGQGGAGPICEVFGVSGLSRGVVTTGRDNLALSDSPYV